MSDERFTRDGDRGGAKPRDYDRDYGRDNRAAAQSDRERGGRQRDAGGEYGARNERSGATDSGDPYASEGFGGASYGEMNQGQSRYGAGGLAGSGRSRDSANRNWGEERYGARAYGGHDRDSYLGQTRGGAAYGAAERFDGDRGAESFGRDDRDQGRRGTGGGDQGYDYQDRGFIARAGDEVRSWFGDDDAQRRRELDQRQDEQQGNAAGDRPVGGFDGDRVHFHHDRDYHQWRQRQIDALDRDYHEYRQENHQKFANEFGAWRTERQGQRSLLDRVNEHMEVLGSDGEHVGTVDKVRGDRIILTRKDRDAGGHHHSIPSRWLERVEDKVTIRKTAAEAKAQWRDEERTGAPLGDENDRATSQRDGNAGPASGSASASAASTTGSGSSPMLASGMAVSGAGSADKDGPHQLDKSASGTDQG